MRHAHNVVRLAPTGIGATPAIRCGKVRLRTESARGAQNY
jgi:hypothetical protein